MKKIDTALLLIPLLTTVGCWITQDVLILDDPDDSDASGDTETDLGPTDPDSDPIGDWEWIVEDVPTEKDLTDIWGTSPADIFVVGRQSTIMHYDGNTWIKMEIPDGGGGDLGGVWGSSSSNVYAVGLTGKILHYDGVEWSLVQNGMEYDLYDVCGTNSEQVFAVGTGGVMLRLVGQNFVQQQIGIEQDLHELWCDEGGEQKDVYAVGHVSNSGTASIILHMDAMDGTLEEMPHAATGKMYGISGTTGNNIWAAGWRPGNLEILGEFDLFEHDSGTWTVEHTGPYLIRDLLAVSQNELWAVGRANPTDDDYGIVYHLTGSDWEEVRDFHETTSVEAVWSDTSETYSPVFVVGKDGFLARRNWVWAI